MVAQFIKLELGHPGILSPLNREFPLIIEFPRL